MTASGPSQAFHPERKPTLTDRILATSWGLWRRRRDLRTLLGGRVLPPGTPARLADVAVGWGDRPSGRRARATGLPFVLFEDGFLSGYAPPGRKGSDVPPASYILDRQGAHYDGSRATELETLIRDGDFPSDELAQAERAMALLRETRLSKYNAAPPLTPDELGIRLPFVLLLEQVEGDRSLGDAGPETFEAMLREAKATGHDLLVRAHPAARGIGPLARQAAAFGARVLDRPCNPWPLLEGAERVFTHSSHAGFEALLAGTPVTTFGQPFYAGWGVTDDRALFPRRAPRPLAWVFAAAYLRASRYLDIHDRRETTLEATIEALAALRDARNRNRPRVVSVGFSPWRRRATEPFLTGPGGPPRHARSLDAALAMEPDDIAVWSTREVPDLSPRSIRVVRLEDGFVRSRGLGAALRMPLSLVRETGPHMHFDATGGTGPAGSSGIERALRDDPPGEAELARARAIMNGITARNLTKYMLSGDSGALPRTDRLKVLVVGQVEDDASIRLGAPGVSTNTGLLAAVRDLYPDALIAYRDHPDVLSGLRRGKALRTHVDLDVDAHPITALIDWCDRVETMTSLKPASRP